MCGNDIGNLMMFGNGCDLFVRNHCNLNFSSESNLGISYKLPNGLTKNSLEAKQYLSGSKYF